MTWNVSVPTTAKADFEAAVRDATFPKEQTAGPDDAKQLAAAKKSLVALFKSATVPGKSYSATLGGHEGAISVALHGY